ncbi:hypothetical protein Pcinc_027684 [Petrolisthes cinctipes]|uniref:FAD dependent oxidoreductase domain-containing protein n=1 Tax=Petrolisthes cinctipes TaxID=88211 RepID=A0AAE1F3X1_PETCI|nr:hypothetical protein Pcinc_027684 [Petrolisthes cinctipes]
MSAPLRNYGRKAWRKTCLPVLRRGVGGVGGRAASTEHTHTTIPAKEVPESADVVVIGGGSLGCNTLYHLAKLGVTNTVLLETHALTAGTTWHTQDYYGN